MGALSSNQRIWLAALEAAGDYRTNEVQAALVADTNLVALELLSGSQIVPAPAPVRPDVQRAGAAGTKSTFVKNISNATINANLRGGVGANFVPVLDMFHQACGLSQVSSSGGTTVYRAIGTNNASASMACYARAITGAGINHRVQAAAGAVGTATITLTAGQPATISYELQIPDNCEWSAEDAYWDASEPILDLNGDAITYAGTISQDNGELLICKSMKVTVGGTTYPVSSATIQLNWNIAPSADVHGDPPVARIMRTRGSDANISGNLALGMIGMTEADYAVALDDVLTKYRASTEAALAVNLSGATSKIDFAMPKIQFTRPTERDDAGTLAWDVGYTANGDYASSIHGDNDLSITYAAAT